MTLGASKGRRRRRRCHQLEQEAGDVLTWSNYLRGTSELARGDFTAGVPIHLLPACLIDLELTD